jgi:enoyl-CoA hydratase
MTPVVLTETRGAVLVITLNRPDVRNAVDSALAAALAAALDALDADPALTVGVLTGAGKGFSAGMDLRAFTEGDLGLAGDRGFAGITRRAAEKPLIAAVEGFALAGGFEIALACDLIVAAAGSRFGLPEVSRSLLAAAGGLRRLPARAPASLAYEIALTGQPISAERAYEVGIVNRLAEPGRALDVALELAARSPSLRRSRSCASSRAGATRSSGRGRTNSRRRSSRPRTRARVRLRSSRSGGRCGDDAELRVASRGAPLGRAVALQHRSRLLRPPPR